MHVLVSKTMRGDAYGCFNDSAPRVHARGGDEDEQRKDYMESGKGPGECPGIT